MNDSTRPARSASILLIEDDREALTIFQQILQDNGFQVHTAPTAEAGLQQLEACQPDAVILDLHLPVLDGLACLQRMRALPQLAHIPATIITGDYLMDDEVACQIEALNARLRLKPIWEEDLLQIVRESTDHVPAEGQVR